MQALRLALINNDKAGLHYVRKSLRKRAEEVQSGKLKVHAQYPGESVEAVKEGYLRPMRVRRARSAHHLRALSRHGFAG